MEAPLARHSGHGMAVRDVNQLSAPQGFATRKIYTSRYGCFNASSTLILLFGLNVKHFSIKSIASGFAFGNNCEKGRFLRNGNARMYSRERGEEIA